ncbi:MAG: undecaprenyldiphospho-muramoylpentapeptide beta-N-acetylglucosaminyltransferase [Planctomycetaceae bacterium]|nr:undecaprenyldiphospho-muramoylpentapeptide beta-N-acetylglucosaminyltransferase [Planctomycetaceae bacterium]
MHANSPTARLAERDGYNGRADHVTTPLYVFAGGGTGGHLFPGIAVAERLVEREPDARVLFLGTDRPIEREILSETAFEHLPIVREGQGGSWQRAVAMMRAYRDAVGRLRNDRPRAVIGCGGGASVPPVLAARRLRIPVFLLEQNVIPGRATRLLSRFDTTVCLTYPESQPLLPKSAHSRVTGNPVRQAIAELATAPRDDADGSHRPTLLVLGGSQGAHAINQAVLSVAEDARQFLNGWRVIHQTGERDVDDVRAAYQRLGINAVVEPFFEDLVPHYRNSHMVVSRAGGTTLSEVACAGLPAILVPYPHAMDDHQTANANVFVREEAAFVIPSLDTSYQQSVFSRLLVQSLSNPELRNNMAQNMRSLARPQAADDVSALVIKRSMHD